MLDRFASWILYGDSAETEGSDFNELSTFCQHSDPKEKLAPEIPARLGRFRILALLGSGQFGDVYRAHDELLNREVALKVYRRSQIQEPNVLEGRSLAQLDHPNIVKVFDVGESDDGDSFVAAELIEGENLDTVIQSRKFTVEEALELVRTLAEGLHHAHTRGVVHRDVKPANILLRENGIPVIVDFGLALRDDQVELTPALAGTLKYMSPEQANFNSQSVDGRTDIFSLGVVLYQLLTGRLPYSKEEGSEIIEQIKSLRPKPPRQINDQIAPEIERICLRSLEKRPEDRFSTARDFAQAIKTCQSRTVTSSILRRIVLLTLGVCLLAGVSSVFLRQRIDQPLSSLLPLKTELEITHYDRSGSKPRNAGAIDGRETAPVKLGDSIRVEARFSRPTYAVLLTLDNNGETVLQVPQSKAPSLELGRTLRFPSGATSVYTMDDIGLQGILVVTFEQKPASYAALRKIAEKYWRAKLVGGKWEYNDGKFQPLVSSKTRGKIETLEEIPMEFRQICEAIATSHEVDSVSGVTFPVKASQ